MDTPSTQTSTQAVGTRSKIRSQVRSLKRSLHERTQSRFPGNPLGVDVQATDLALRSSQLVLEAMSVRSTATRAASRKGRDASKLMRSSA